MLIALIAFVHRLREAAIPVSMVETLDAVESLRHVDPSDRALFKATLAATLVKRAEHRAAFDALFDVYFSSLRGDAPSAPGPATPLTSPVDLAGAEMGARASEALLDALLDALRRSDADALRALAARAVHEFGGIDAQRAGPARYYLYRVLRQLDLSALLKRALRDEREQAGDRTAFDERLMREDQGRRIEELRQLIAEEIRRRLVELRGSRQAAAAYHQVPIEDVDFLAASPARLREMRVAIRPLARKLAARIAHRRRLRRHGRLDVRRTIRRSLAAGGVPLDPAFRYPRVSKPDLFLLCDISGSVGEFASFTMSLLYAMNEEFSKIRSFVFVDGIDEVTGVFEDRSIVLDAAHLLARADVVWADGHSDYGNVFTRFWSTCGRAALGPKATVIITGDARNNYRDAGVEALRAIKERVRRVYWLNPEPRSNWDTTDSIMSTYAPYCDGVFEARTLRQLADFARGIA
jgi:uncharacterized protein with von Willebrand factor type A (vWA) domain